MMYVNLPQPTDALLSAVRHFAQGVATSDNRSVFNAFYKNKINPVVYEFAPAFELAEISNKEFQTVLGEPAIPVVGVMKNVTEEPAELPPHVDKLRKAAINFVVDAGGDSVETKFYNVQRSPNADLNTGLNFQYNQIAEVESHVLNEHQWHVVDVQRVHSVHNVTGTRLLFGLVVESNPDYKSFLERYKERLC
jgi:hypothetical protein